MIALVDTGFLYALFDAGDAQHRDAVQTLQTPGLEPLLPDTVIVELAYLLQARLGHARMRFYLKRSYWNSQHGLRHVVDFALR